MTTLAIPCWIVCGRTAWSGSLASEYDELTWIVRAFERQEDAEAFFGMANKWLQERELHIVKTDHQPVKPPEWDPDLRVFDSAYYFITGPKIFIRAPS